MYKNRRPNSMNLLTQGTTNEPYIFHHNITNKFLNHKIKNTMNTNTQNWCEAYEIAERFIEDHGLITGLKVAEKLAEKSPLIYMRQKYAMVYLIIFFEMELLTNEYFKP